MKTELSFIKRLKFKLIKGIKKQNPRKHSLIDSDSSDEEDEESLEELEGSDLGSGSSGRKSSW